MFGFPKKSNKFRKVQSTGATLSSWLHHPVLLSVLCHPERSATESKDLGKELIMELTKVKLSDVSHFVEDKISSSDVRLEDYITTDNLLQNKQGRVCASNLPPKPCSLIRFQKGDVLVANIRPYLKKIWQATSSGGASNDVLVIRANDETLSEYIYSLLLQDDFYTYVMKAPKGSKMPRGDHKHIMRYPILDIPHKKEIGRLVAALDDKIALNKKMNQKLEAIAKRLYDYWFVQYDFPDKNGHPYKTTGGPMTYSPTLKREIPVGWEVKKVSDYADLITKGTTPSTLGFDFQDTGINFVKVECIENGQILQENLMHISEEANVAMKRSQLRSNDILVTIAGRLGSTAIVSDNILPANTNQAVALIRLKKEYGHLVNYIYRVISSSSMQKRLQGSNAQSIQKNLTLPILGDIEFVQDSNCEIIKRFNEITKPIFLEQQENIQEISHLTKLRDKLLPLLMNGQVVI